MPESLDDMEEFSRREVEAAVEDAKKALQVANASGPQMPDGTPCAFRIVRFPWVPPEETPLSMIVDVGSAHDLEGPRL